jgi:hypothetical protein
MWPAFGVLHGARKEFWEAKAAANWSAEEKQMLLTQSPWALEGMVQFEAQGKKPTVPYQGAPRPGAGVPGARPGERLGTAPSVPFGEAPPPVPKGDTGRPVQFRVLARWETAKPVRLAGGPELPEGTERFYVIRLRGMPLLPVRKGKDGETLPNPNEEMLAEIRQTSRIVRKEKAAIACAHLLTGSGETANELLLFFERGPDPITAGEKTVTLESHFGPFRLSLPFPLKDMMYQGALAL